MSLFDQSFLMLQRRIGFFAMMAIYFLLVIFSIYIFFTLTSFLFFDKISFIDIVNNFPLLSIALAMVMVIFLPLTTNILTSLSFSTFHHFTLLILLKSLIACYSLLVYLLIKLILIVIYFWNSVLSSHCPFFISTMFFFVSLIFLSPYFPIIFFRT